MASGARLQVFSVILSIFLLSNNDLPWWIIVAVAISLGSYFYTALLHGELLGVTIVAFQVSVTHAAAGGRGSWA